MRIIAIEKYPTLLKGGSEKAYFEMLSLLSRKGHKIVLYYCQDGDLIPKLNDIGIETVKIERSNLQNIFSPQQWLELYESYKVVDKNVDIIYLNYLHDTPLALLIKLAGKIKIVCHLRVASTFICRQLKFTGKFVDQFIVLNRRQQMVFSGHFPTNKFAVIPDGVHFQNKTYSKEPGKQSGAVYLGRIAKEKGLISLLQAWVMLRDQYKLPIPLTITGPADSDEEQEFRLHLEGMIKKLDLQSLVTTTPYTADPVAYLSNFQFSVFPSTCEETFGRTLVESVMAGTVVFARDIGITSEILKPECEKLVFKTDNDLCAKIWRYVNGDSVINMANLYNHVRRHYNIHENIKLTEGALLTTSQQTPSLFAAP